MDAVGSVLPLYRYRYSVWAFDIKTGVPICSGTLRNCGANFDDDAGAQGKVHAEPFGKGHLPALRCPSEAKPTPPGVAGNTVDQNQAKPCRRGCSVYTASWNWSVNTEFPVELLKSACVRGEPKRCQGIRCALFAQRTVELVLKVAACLYPRNTMNACTTARITAAARLQQCCCQGAAVGGLGKHVVSRIRRYRK